MVELSKQKSCCAGHRRKLINESVGLPLLALAEVNFLQCFLCRSTPPTTLVLASSSGDPSPSPSLDEFFHEYSVAVSARSLLKRSRAVFRETPRLGKHASCRERCIVQEPEVGGDNDNGARRADAANDGGADEDEGQLPHHLLLSDSVLSHLPLADAIRARHVCRAWMSTINDALQNPCSQVHAYIRRPCLMLLHPGSEKIGTCATLSVFDFSSNAWLTKPILFPSKASYLVGASLGLFCFATGGPVGSDFVSNNVDFYVGNPLTETWTLVPCPPRTHCKCRGKVTEAVFAFVAYINPNRSHSLGFKLIKIRRKVQQASNKLYIYDSCTGRWDKDRLNGCSIKHSFFETPGVLHCFHQYWSLGCLYNLATRTSETFPSRDIWHDGLAFVGRCAEITFCVRKVQHGFFGQTIVGLIPCFLHKWAVGVFRLVDNARWELVSQMPTSLLKEAVEEGSDGTDFVIGSDHTHRMFFILKGSSKMLVFNVLSSDWDTLPGCTYVPSFYPYKLHAFCEPLI